MDRFVLESLRRDRQLLNALRAMRGKYTAGQPVVIRDILEPLGDRALALGAVLLALPFLSPISFGPFTMPVSAVVGYLGWRILRGRRDARLPEKLERTPVPKAAHGVMAKMSMWLIRWKRRHSGRRLTWLIEGDRGRILCGSAVILSALLLAVPIPLLPLTNTFPALAIVLLMIAWAEDDGLLLLLGLVATILAIVWLATLGLLVWIFGREVLTFFWPG